MMEMSTLWLLFILIGIINATFEEDEDDDDDESTDITIDRTVSFQNTITQELAQCGQISMYYIRLYVYIFV